MKLKFKHQSYQDDAVRYLLLMYLKDNLKDMRRDLLARYKTDLKELVYLKKKKNLKKYLLVINQLNFLNKK